LLAEHIVL